MKLINRIICLIIITMGVSAAQECRPVINIKADIKNVHIYINNRLIGENDFVTTEVDTGRIIIMAVENSDRYNARSYTDTIFATGCKVYNFFYEFSLKTLLRTIPEDVYVYENDTLWGNTPLFISEKKKELILVKPGYLTKTISYADIVNNKMIMLEPLQVMNGKSFFSEYKYQLLFGSLLALGVVSTYYKLKADDYFEDYEFSGDRGALDRTRKYDLISGITFTALQINFGMLIYYFLTE